MRTILIALPLALTFCSCQARTPPFPPRQRLATAPVKPALPVLTVTSSDFKNNDPLPARFAYHRGGQVCPNPTLKWSPGPAKTKSYAILCEDPDAPGGVFTHWVVFNIPRTNMVDQSRALAYPGPGFGDSGFNDFGSQGYQGPNPPPGKVHHYHFKVTALDCMLRLSGKVTGNDLRKAMKGHELARGEIVATYQR